MDFSALITPVAAALFVFFMAYAAMSDLTTMRIRNTLILSSVAAYFVLALLSGLPLQEIATDLGVAAAVLAVGIAFFARGWLGGGDVKLAAATALWIGAGHVPAYLVYSALLGGLLTLALLQFRAFALPLVLHRRSWILRLHAPTTGVPYGVALATAALVVLPQTRWVSSVF